MANERSERIKDSMKEIFRQYNTLKLKSSGSDTTTDINKVDKPTFWDIVVLTTFDAGQQQSFRHQIDLKRKHGQLPEVPIYVVADPPDQKLGVGGSTLHVLSEFYKEFGNALFQKKLLIIHSGGSSQRLPSYSVLGKIFAPIPVKGLSMDSETPQMLDLKLSMYLPFCKLLGPGVFVTCADDIETYCLYEKTLDMESFKSADVIALGHPSSIRIGEGHGVYVVGNGSPQSSKQSSSLQECLEVLQKPSEDAMRARGAVFVKEEGGTLRELVWSDSVFWLSEQVCQNLLQWYTRNTPISSELDAYAHFLPCLGTRMVDAKPCDFQDFRSAMLPILQGFNLKVLLLNDSEFYHMGTMKEYLMYFNIMKCFCEELEIIKNTSNMHVPCRSKAEGYLQPDSFDGGMIIETYFSDSSIKIDIPEDSAQFVIENCHIDLPFRICGNIILSNCVIQECCNISLLSKEPKLFGNLLYHTVPIIFQGKSLYVTAAFDLNADMKKVAHDLSDISNFGSSLKDISRILGYKTEEVVSASSNKVSLWTARIFLAGPTAAESFWLTHHTINKVKQEKDGEPIQTDIDDHRSSQLFSMSDVVKFKDLEVLLKDREHLSSCLRNCPKVVV